MSAIPMAALGCGDGSESSVTCVDRATVAKTCAGQARRADVLAPPALVHGALPALGREADPPRRGQLIDLIGPSCASDLRAIEPLAAQFKQETEPTLRKAFGRYVPAGKLGS